MDVNSVIASYTINGAPQESDSNMITGHNVDSVTFAWNVFPGSPVGPGFNSEIDAQFLFQIFGWGTRRPRGTLP